jgi:hypothetical protein
LQQGGCSSVVERMLCMYEAPGSIPGISKILLLVMYKIEIVCLCTGLLG